MFQEWHIFLHFCKVAYNIAFNMYHLAKNPEIQQKLYKEIRDVISPSNNITYKLFDKMTYLKAVVKETYRWAFAYKIRIVWK